MKLKLISLISAFTLLVGACSNLSAKLNCVQTAHTLVGNPSSQILWSKSGIAVFDDGSTQKMQGLGSIVYVAALDTGYSSGKFFAFDTNTGNMLWHQSYTPPATLFTNNDKLYVGNYDNIQEYDSQTGEMIKEMRFPNVGLVTNIYFSDQNLYALTSSDRWLTYNLDTDVFSSSEPLLPYTPFMVENEILYLHDVEGFKAIETKTKRVLWKRSIDDQINIHPLFINGTIVIPASTGNIYSVNQKTGDLMWNVGAHAISNIAFDQSRLYYLTMDGFLRILDMKSGQEIQKIEFSSVPFRINTPDSQITVGAYDLWMDTKNDVLIVSFGDSCQLMAIKP